MAGSCSHVVQAGSDVWQIADRLNANAKKDRKVSD